ncbi:MAG: tripartite tricarboxylate transporter permease [Alphaproteobacteria bacterium]|nr:tripartite tricarboxylate transporter permease [Alphaproteobacteria bacterium]
MDATALLTGLTLVLEPTNILLIFVAVLTGVLVGALPGLSSTMAVALLLPLTIGMEKIPAICMMAALYCAGTFGGSITAILINAPGAPPAVATAFDGYPLAQRGEAGRALGVAAFSSVIGGIISLAVFLVATPLLAAVALHFGPPEYFALAVFGLSMLATISGRSSLRNLIAGVFGVLVSTVGIHLFTGVDRFVFMDLYHLQEGVGFVPVLIGLFAFGELLNQSQNLNVTFQRIKALAVKLPSRADLRRLKGVILRSSGIGTFIGVLPAEGPTVAAIIGYNEAKRWSKEPEAFGKGSIEGIAGPEAANNAAAGGAMVPTLALGIPGSGATAVILAALIMHGFRPGPALIRETPEFLYAIFGAMLMANFMFFVIGLGGAKIFSRVTLIPRTFLWPTVLVFSVVGTYSLNQSPFDIYVMLIAGLLAFLMLRHGFGPAPFVMGLILGKLVEEKWSQAMVIYDNNMLLFLERPIVVLFLILAMIGLFWGPLSHGVSRLRKT